MIVWNIEKPKCTDGIYLAGRPVLQWHYRSAKDNNAGVANHPLPSCVNPRSINSWLSHNIISEGERMWAGKRGRERDRDKEW